MNNDLMNDLVRIGNLLDRVEELYHSAPKQAGKTVEKETVKQPGRRTVTKEQFENMTLVQKSELYENDPETYHRLLGK